MTTQQIIGWSMIASMVIVAFVTAARFGGFWRTVKTMGLVLGGIAFYGVALYLIGTPP